MEKHDDLLLRIYSDSAQEPLFGSLEADDPLIRVYVDSSSDCRRAAFAALILEGGKKPRLIYGIGRCISPREVEAWGIKRAIRRVNIAYEGNRPILVVSDNQWLVRERLGSRVRYFWVPRDDGIIQQLHQVANTVRKSLPITQSELEPAL